jgi:murein DD-endopeptidase MepM/ murein hydrolase activator NlpD
MQKNSKFFIYSDETGTFREIHRFKLKSAGVLFSLLVLGICTILLLNHVYFNFLDLGYRRTVIVEMENKILREQINSFTGKIEKIENALVDFADRDTELRLFVDLPTIDEDTRRAGVGGTAEELSYGILAGTSREILNETHRWIERLEREIQLQRESYKEIEHKLEFNDTFFHHLPAIKPAVGRYNPNGYGRRRHPVLGIMHVHEGIDIACDTGTPVYATADGTVEIAGRTNGGYGRVIIINHGYGYKTLYAHLSSTINVKPRQKVKRGDIIAQSGRSGLVTGPHLHYEVIYNGVKQNPVDYFFDDIDFHRAKQEFAEVVKRRR